MPGTAAKAVRTFETFYEGELKWKSGKVSKTKIFATILKGDPSFYIIDRKLLPRVDGKIPDRVNPYTSNFKIIENSENQDYQLSPGWIKFSLETCQIMPSKDKKKCFKLLLKAAEENKKEKE